MSRKGGPSTANGVSYQALAIVRKFFDIYSGEIDSIRAEVPPKADFGEDNLIKVEVDDFVVCKDNIRHYYQVKSNSPGGGNWTISKLLQEDILQDFAKQVILDKGCSCCLVSPSNCLLLDDIASRAEEAVGVDEFIHNLTGKQKAVVEEALERLRMSREQLFYLLCHCKLEIRSKQQFEQELNSLAKIHFAEPRTALDALFRLAVNAMEIGGIVDLDYLKAFLVEQSAFEKPKASIEESLLLIKNASSRLRNVSKDIAGVHFIQSTVSNILQWVEESNKLSESIAVLLDQAGSGKTVSMSVLLNRLETKGFDVLGIKVDGLSFSSLSDLGVLHGFSDSIPSVLQTLNTNGRRVVFLIDQMDAVSSSMLRDSNSIEVVLDLIRQVGNLRIPIVLACRKFDWAYDHRLNYLRENHPKEFSLSLFTDKQLMDLLFSYSLNLYELDPLTIEIIRCPLRLKIFIEIIQANRQSNPNWSPGGAIFTLQSLYQNFWMLKMHKATSVGIPNCEGVVIALANYMHDYEQFAAPESIVSNYLKTVEWLVSEGILELNGKVLSFFHQTFFDFIFARWFVGNNKSLIDHLITTDQGLFYRPMVKQILEYLRDVDFKRYLIEVNELLINLDIRKHLKRLVTNWLGQHIDPKPEELDIIEPRLTDPTSRKEVLNCLKGNSSWFDLLKPERFKWWFQSLAEDEVLQIISYLSFISPQRQNEISSLLSPYLGKSTFWNNAISYCLFRIDGGWGDSAADLLCDLISNPLTDLKNKNGLWAIALEHLAKCLPLKGCKAVNIILYRYIEDWDQYSKIEAPFEFRRKFVGNCLPGAYGFKQTIKLLAVDESKEFLNHVIPWTLEVMQKTCYRHDSVGFKDNPIWNYESYKNSPADNFFSAIKTALQNLAKTNPKVFRDFIHILIPSQLLCIQILIAETYRINAKKYARDALDFLYSGARNLTLNTHYSFVWYSKQLISECCRYWSKEELKKVEELILKIEPYPYKTIDDLKNRGYIKLDLLLSLDKSCLSPEGMNQLNQLERKFPKFKPSYFNRPLVECVGAPIHSESIKKMDDRGWLGALKKYDKDKTYNKPIKLSGGKIHLARELQMMAKEQPERFFKLVMEKMDNSYHIDYIQAIILGISEALAPIEFIHKIINKYNLNIITENRSISSAIGKYVEMEVPEELINLLKHWAKYSSDHVKLDNNTMQSFEEGGNRPDYFTQGINTNRGAAVYEISIILLNAKTNRRGELLSFIKGMVNEKSISIRAVYIHFLTYTITEDSDLACKLFKELIGDDLVLLGDQGAYNFIYYNCNNKHIVNLLWAVKAMINKNQYSETREAGAKLSCLAAFACSEAIALRDECINGDVPLRKGAASIYSANLFNNKVGMECRKKLVAFFNDENLEVRNEASSFIKNLDGEEVKLVSDFLIIWSETKALSENGDHVSYMLENNPVSNPLLTLKLSEKILGVIGSEINNIQTRNGIIPYHLVPAVLNVYHRSFKSEIRKRAIDIFEKLEELECSEVKIAMESVDRM